MIDASSVPDSSIWVSTLICHNNVQTGVQCLKSVAANCGVRLHIFDDGTLSGDDTAILMDALPTAIVVPYKNYADPVLDHIRTKPACQQFWKGSVFRAKTFAIPLMSNNDIRYIDSDILFFRPCPSAFNRPFYECDAIFMKDITEAYSVRPWHLMGPRPLRLCSSLNSGFILMAKERYDLDFLEWILSRYSGAFARFPPWAEQTIWSALAVRCATKLICSDSMLLMRPGVEITSSAVAGHFVSTYRHLLKDFVPIDGNGDISTLRTEPARSCTPLLLSREIISARFSWLSS
ncbi:MAG: hypothetical protein ACLPY1_02280 [Terracidiphilus sp.]